MIARKVTLVFITLFLLTATSRAEDVIAPASITVAEKWLIAVDEEKYGESWNQASESLKSIVTQSQWDQSLQFVRKPLGKVLSRKVKSSKQTTSPAGTPGGEFVLIEFETSFVNNKSAIEVVISAKDKDASWRVANYYIKS